MIEKKTKIRAPVLSQEILDAVAGGSIIESSENDRYTRESRERKTKSVNAPRLKINKEGENL